MALLAACAVVLRVHTGQGVITLGSPMGMRERPEFPVPIRISSNRLAWRRSVIRAYVASRPLRETRNKTALKSE